VNDVHIYNTTVPQITVLCSSRH